MGLDFGYGSPGCGEEDNRPVIISKVHFLHFTIILFFISLFTTFAVSLMTQPINEEHVSNYGIYICSLFEIYREIPHLHIKVLTV